MRRLLLLCFLVPLLHNAVYAQKSRILLIPLDDRPPCLQFTEKMADIAGVEVVAPPRGMLGRFTEAGKPEEIISWILSQDLHSYQAAIISLDMLAYGGLVASRVHQSETAASMNRLKVIRELKKRAPKLRIYGQSVIMRLAPTGDGKNEAYREKLARWAEISPYAENITQTAELAAAIPAEALSNYQNARLRNYTINQEAIRMVETGIIDYLILSQDDAKPRGIHVADRERLINTVNIKKLDKRIIVQPGTDEISMLLLARALNKTAKASPKVFVRYSSDSLANTAMPFEDRPLRRTVSYNIIASGATELSNEAAADLHFYVYPSRFQPGVAKSFAGQIEKAVKAGKRLIVADVDPKGNTQGGDPQFTTALIEAQLISDLYGYASWNTAGNTIGTALPQGLIYHLAQKTGKVSASAQQWFLLHRLTDDYAFHTVVRPKANDYFRQSNRSGFEQADQVARGVEKFSLELIRPLFLQYADIFKRKGFQASDLTLTLPWNRTFEAEIGFSIKK